MASFWDRLMVFYRQGSVVTKLIFINTGIFLLLRLIVGVLALFRLGDKAWLDWLLVPATFPALLQRPWTLFTYAFVHYDLMHLLMNMLWLYFFGLLFQRWFSGIQLVVHYLVGGLAGGLLFMAGNTWLAPAGETILQAPLIGASAAIMALCVAVAVYRPDEPISLFVLGSVKLKYIALVMIALDLLGFNQASMGVGLAHLGGALYGVLVGLTSRRGINLAAWADKGSFRFKRNTGPKRRKQPNMKVTYRRPKKETVNRSTVDVDQAYRDKKKADEQQLDTILDKVKQSGYDSLTKDEKKLLFDFSNRSNH
jgi:membrane associated rhomboid family serine protease